MLFALEKIDCRLTQQVKSNGNNTSEYAVHMHSRSTLLLQQCDTSLSYRVLNYEKCCDYNCLMFKISQDAQFSLQNDLIHNTYVFNKDRNVYQGI